MLKFVLKGDLTFVEEEVKEIEPTSPSLEVV